MTVLNIVVTVLGLTAGLLIIAFLVRKALPAIKRARAYSLAMQESGHLGDPPSDKDFNFMLKFAGFFVRHFVGKLTVIGAEKLAEAKAPAMVIFNHGSLLDVAIAPIVLNRKARYPAAQGVMQAFGGLTALLFGRWGVYAVNLENGAAAREATSKVMKQREMVVLFPEAWTNMDGVVKPFTKTGAIRTTREAAEFLGEEIKIYPGYMRYGRYPGKWILKLPIPLQWAVPLVGWFRYKRGCTIVIGDGIGCHSLPSDPHEAMNALHQAVVSLDPGK
jgi:1-acyl-sn-glycerol-3-phosphate acyltransferase